MGCPGRMDGARFAALAVWAGLATACAGGGGGAAASRGDVSVSGVAWDGSVLSEQETRYQAFVGTKGMVVADDPGSARWGAEVLRRGGNAIDAAVATAFAMSVTRPHHSSLGGGGFLVYCPKPDPAKGGKQPCMTLDYREEAPSKASRDMYVKEGKARTDLSQNGALASGVPGVPAGLLAALERYGSRPRAELLSGPIEMARRGFAFTGHLEAAAADRWSVFNEETKRLLGCDPQGRQWGVARLSGVPAAPCPPGALIRQADLARVLEAISRHGVRGFYEGWVARKIATGLQASGGILSLEDLKAYRPRWREPVTGPYRGMEVVSMPPPSAGGTVLLMMLGYADRADAQGELAGGYGSARSIHAITHAMALAYADRAEHFGDPGFWNVPVKELLSPAYLDSRWRTFDPGRAALPAQAGPIRSSGKASAAPLAAEGQHTTHFSVIDREGNAVAITTTINENYGSGFTPPGTGIVMNNEMDDFSVRPGVPNLFGLVGAEANSIAAGKRPLSSMAPTIVRDAGGNARIVIGAAGGPRITTSVFLSIVNRLRFGMSLTDAVASPRFHQQWRPERLKVERQGFGLETLARLEELGYELDPDSSLAKVHALERFPNGRVWGAPDFRGEGGAAAE